MDAWNSPFGSQFDQILRGRKQHDPLPPKIIHSGQFEECYARMREINPNLNEKDLIKNGLPVFATNDWTYYIVASPPPRKG